MERAGGGAFELEMEVRWTVVDVEAKTVVLSFDEHLSATFEGPGWSDGTSEGVEALKVAPDGRHVEVWREGEKRYLLIPGAEDLEPLTAWSPRPASLLGKPPPGSTEVGDPSAETDDNGKRPEVRTDSGKPTTCPGCGRDYVGYLPHLESSRRCPTALQFQERAAASQAQATANEVIEKCPQCKSDRVAQVDGFYDFTKMRCHACGHEELCDPWQLDQWYEARGSSKAT